MILTGEYGSARTSPYHKTTFPPKVLHRVVSYWTQAFVVYGRRLTVWAIARSLKRRPCCYYKHKFDFTGHSVAGHAVPLTDRPLGTDHLHWVSWKRLKWLVRKVLQDPTVYPATNSRRAFYVRQTPVPAGLPVGDSVRVCSVVFILFVVWIRKREFVRHEVVFQFLWQRIHVCARTCRWSSGAFVSRFARASRRWRGRAIVCTVTVARPLHLKHGRREGNQWLQRTWRCINDWALQDKAIHLVMYQAKTTKVKRDKCRIIILQVS